MKAPTVVLATLALTAFANAQLAERTPGSEMRTWTNTDGVEIQASLVEKRESSVLLKLENGRQYDVPLEKLSGSDIAWIEEMEAAKVAAAEASEGLAFSPILAEVGSVIFEDNLSEIREGWGMGNGEWKNDEEGALIGKELEADDHAATFRRNLQLENAVIQFSFKLDGARATTFSIDNSTGHLCRLSINASGFTAQKDDNDKDKGPDTGEKYNSIEMDLADGEWHTAMFEMVGDTVLAQVDGEDDEISIGAHEMFTGSTTKIGFTISGESVHFKDLRVWEAQPKEGWESDRDKLLD